MKQRIIYLVIALFAGLAMGYLLFGTSTSKSKKESEHQHSEARQQLWTCSMHPQILQQEAGDCPICGMDLIPAENNATGLAPDQFEMTPNAVALADIQTTVVGSAAQSESTTTLSGKIAINEEKSAVQASYFSGRIERLFINFKGQKVQKGQLLATLYAPELVAAQQELLSTMALKETQPELYQAVRKKLQLWKLTEDEINAIETSGEVAEYFSLRATVAGTVTELLSAEGDYLAKGQPIVKLADLRSVWANFDVYESQVSQFKIGQAIRISTATEPHNWIDGTVSFIAPVLNEKTRTLSLRATLNIKEEQLKPGMFVNGEIASSTLASSKKLFIPASAVLWTGKRSLVYVKTDPAAPVFEMREVELGNKKGNQFEILKGLSLGEEIVVNGTFTVDAAAQLQGKKSMMNQKGDKTMTGHEGHDGMHTKQSVSSAQVKSEISEDAQKKFKAVLGAYLELKDALVQSNAKQATTAAKASLTALAEVDRTSLDATEKNQLSSSVTMLQAMVATTEIEKQRSHFVLLNENLVALISNFNALDIPLYVQKCPMANNNQGAIWLSSEKEIQNPYYGDAMLKCGSVIQTL